jgi:hypothetical protein
MSMKSTIMPASAMDLEQAKTYIQSTDLSMVEDRLTYIDNWPRKKALQAVSVYRNYLYLVKKYPDNVLPPSYEIDEAWHAHILFTRHYVTFCQELFGYYLHHDPHEMQQKDGVQQLENLFETTQELYQKEFGDYLYHFKRRPWHIQKILRKISRMT